MMKKLFIFAAVMAAVMCSCSDKKSEEEPIDPEPIVVLPYEDPDVVGDQTFLQNTGLGMMDYITSEELSNYEDIVKALDRYDADAIEDQYEDAINALKQYIGETTPSSWKVYSNYKALLRASTFNGHFTVSGNKWQYQPANDIMFTFPDIQGKQVVATVTTGGATKNVYLFDSRDYKYYDSYDRKDHYDVTQITVAIPEVVNVKVTQGGQVIIDSESRINLSNIVEGAKYDLSLNNASVTSVTKIATTRGVFTVNVSKASYTAKQGAETEFTLSKDGARLIYGKASCNANLTNDEVLSLNNINFVVDIIGRVQLKGTCSDGKKFVDYLEKADDYRENESSFKEYLNRANGLADIKYYANGTDKVRGTVAMEPFSKTRNKYVGWDPSTQSSMYRDVVVWNFKPVLTIAADGAKYTFEDNATESAFQAVIDKIEDLIDGLEEKFDL